MTRAAAVREVTKPFRAGEHTLVMGDEVIDPDDRDLLLLEHESRLAAAGSGSKTAPGGARRVGHVCSPVYAVRFLHPSSRTACAARSASLSGRSWLLFCVTVLLSELVSRYLWGTEVIPLLLLGMTVAIAYQQEMALILAASVNLLITIAIGLDMQQSLVLLATVAGAIVVLKQVRTRGKLFSVGFVAGWSRCSSPLASALCTAYPTIAPVDQRTAP